MTSPHTPEVEAIVAELISDIDDCFDRGDGSGHIYWNRLEKLLSTTLTTLHTQHAVELAEARAEERERIGKAIDQVLLTQAQYGEFAKGWGTKGSDRHEGYVTGSMDVNSRIMWALAAIGVPLDMGKPATPDTEHGITPEEGTS